MRKIYPFEAKSIEELVREANELIRNSQPMTEEEEIEDDAEWGYFQEEDD